MGFPLGVLFVNFYMGIVEERVFKKISQPDLYVRYIDDTFVNTANVDCREELRRIFEECSSLRFTLEHNLQGRLDFLDVLVETSDNTFNTSVHVKPTNLGLCLNGESALVGIKLPPLRPLFGEPFLTVLRVEVPTRRLPITKILVNNGFTKKDINRQIKQEIKKWYQNESPDNTNTPAKINLYYKGLMSINYKEEKTMKNIIKNNVFAPAEDIEINLIIYYQSAKTQNPIMKNNPAPAIQDDLKETNVVYRYKCPVQECLGTYIGMTMMHLSKRLSCHVQQGAIKMHCL
ncbi:uncharacterized protein [Palaemon carinicauda]|uniref:uncharacterized protein n=1 Tax=Palaemon carinicauda TaxID=392227 RepID=UPI0035B5F7E3